MISAFGVDHGDEVAKGLRPLKPKLPLGQKLQRAGGIADRKIQSTGRKLDNKVNRGLRRIFG